MGVVVDSHDNPRYLAERKQVDAVLRFTGVYVTGGVALQARDFSLSTITDVDDAIAEGFVLRWAGSDMPHRVKLLGKDSETGNQQECDAGYDISTLNDVRVRVWGW